MAKKQKKIPEHTKKAKLQIQGIRSIKKLEVQIIRLSGAIKELVEIVNNHGVFLNALIDKGIISHEEIAEYDVRRLKEISNERNKIMGEEPVRADDMPIQENSKEPEVLLEEETIQPELPQETVSESNESDDRGLATQGEEHPIS